MTEKEIQKLGFNKEIVLPEASGMDDNFHYYTYDVVDGINLITPANYEVKDDNWHVEFFDTTPNIRFTESIELKTMIDILNKNKDE